MLRSMNPTLTGSSGFYSGSWPIRSLSSSPIINGPSEPCGLFHQANSQTSPRLHVFNADQDGNEESAEHDLAGTAKQIMIEAAEAGCAIILPADGVVAKEFKAGAPSETVAIAEVPADGSVLAFSATQEDKSNTWISLLSLTDSTTRRLTSPSEQDADYSEDLRSTATAAPREHQRDRNQYRTNRQTERPRLFEGLLFHGSS